MLHIGRAVGGDETAVPGTSAVTAVAANRTRMFLMDDLLPYYTHHLRLASVEWPRLPPAEDAPGLKPYSGWLLAGSAAMLAYGFWSAYRTRPQCDVSGGAAARSRSGVARAVLWLAALLWVAAVAINLLIPS